MVNETTTKNIDMAVCKTKPKGTNCYFYGTGDKVVGKSKNVDEVEFRDIDSVVQTGKDTVAFNFYKGPRTKKANKLTCVEKRYKRKKMKKLDCHSAKKYGKKGMKKKSSKKKKK